jgi:uncharacterized protein YbjT (DUF2867 family)
VDAATVAGVEHVVYLSFVGASPTATFTLARDHFDTEEYIKASGIGHTFLRDNIYADLFPISLARMAFCAGRPVSAGSPGWRRMTSPRSLRRY